MLRALTRACLLLCVVSCLSPALFARARFWGYAEQGGKSVLTNNVPSSLPKVMGSFPGSTVTVRNPDNSLATLYSDLTGTAKNNPFTADSTGLWFFYADALSYNVTFSGTGVATPFTITVIDESNICGYDILYPTLAAAVAGIPAYGCLNVVGTWTLTSSISTSASNISIYGQPGSLIKAGANSVIPFVLTGNNVTIRGVTIDGRFSQSAYTGTYGIKATGVTGLKLSWNTITNTASGGILGDTSCTDCYFGHNTYTNIGTGTQTDTAGLSVQNPDNTAIEYETFRHMTSGNCIHAFAIISAGGSPHGSLTEDHIGCYDYGRLGIENSMFQTGSVKFTNNYVECNAVAGCNSGVSLTMTNTGGTPITSEDSLIAYGNTIYTATSGNNCMEMFSNYLNVTDNVCKGNWAVGLVYSNGGIIKGNRFNGARIGMSLDPSDETAVHNALLITNNICQEVITTCIAATSNLVSASSMTLTGNVEIRTPVPADSIVTHTFLAISPETSYAPANITNNQAYLLAGSVPGGFVWKCLHMNSVSDGTSPVKIDGLGCFNLTAAHFGNVFDAGGAGEFTNTTIINNTYVGMLTISTGSPYSTSTVMVYANNKSLTGAAGGSAVTDFTITPYFRADPAKTLLTFNGSCTGAVANSAGILGLSILGLGGTGLACNAGPGSSTLGQHARYACTITNLTVNAASGGADGADGLITVYHGTTPTGTSCTLGTSTTCTATIAGGFSAGEPVNVYMTTDSTNISTVNVNIACQP